MKEAPKNIPKKQVKKTEIKTSWLVVALIVMVVGSVLFAGAIAGWFGGGNRATIDAKDYCVESCEREFIDLTIDEYEEKINNGDSFILFVDQGGCYTADRLREFILNYSGMKGVKAYRMMFSDVRNSSLHDYVKYYPSVVVVSRGKPIVWLRADADEDSDAYNDEEAFNKWLSNYLN